MGVEVEVGGRGEKREKAGVEVGQLGGIYKRRVGSEGGQVGCGGGKPRRKGRGSRKIDEWPSTGGVQQKNREEDVINTRYKAKL